MFMKFSRLLVFLFPSLLVFQGQRAPACDLCNCYIPGPETISTDLDSSTHVFGSVAEQFSHFGSVRDNGVKAPNPTGQYENSFNTQFALGVSFWQDKLALQFTLPYLYRDYKRPEGFNIDRGHVSGIGDMSLLANYRLFQWGTPESSATAGGGKKAVSMVTPESNWEGAMHVYAGLKFPTGDASRIKEEFAEDEIPGAPPSGIHGHDLALSTGSLDGIFGVQFFTRYKRFFLEADGTFTWRGQGLYGYRYDNDITWNAGPGVFLWREGRRAISLEAAFSGEYKGKDTFQGESAEDTGITAVYLGPRLLGTFGNFTADLGVDLPLVIHNTAFQAVVDYRIRAAFSYRF